MAQPRKPGAYRRPDVHVVPPPTYPGALSYWMDVGYTWDDLLAFVPGLVRQSPNHRQGRPAPLTVTEASHEIQRVWIKEEGARWMRAEHGTGPWEEWPELTFAMGMEWRDGVG